MSNILDERGFISLIDNKPFWIAFNQNGGTDPWSHYLNEGEWVTLAKLSQSEIIAYANHRISIIEEQKYHNTHPDNKFYHIHHPQITKPIEASILGVFDISEIKLFSISDMVTFILWADGEIGIKELMESDEDILDCILEFVQMQKRVKDHDKT